MQDKDPELEAMAAIAAALKTLEDDAMRRVLDWATRRFKPAGGRTSQIMLLGDTDEIANLTPNSGYKDFPELFDAANPETIAEKALVAAYWFQVVLGQPDFDSGSLNRELKHLGHPSKNITRDFDGLMAQTPRLVIQTRKSGSAKQARKQYKLTTEGIRTVERMLARERT